jgi:hypothetical protein
MPSTKNNNADERLALFENARCEQTADQLDCSECMPPTEDGTYQQREQRTSRDIADAWKRGE